MFILKKIISQLILPPGIFVVLLMISGMLFMNRKYWKAGVFNIMLASLIWLLSISPVSDLMLRGLEHEYSIPENPSGDVIILLGGGVRGDVPDMSGKAVPSDEMIARMYTAVRLQRRLNVPIIFSGGSVHEGQQSEAPVVRRFLMDIGFPSSKIILEDKSRDTIENARYTAEICSERGFKKPLLITSAYHMKRSVMCFKKAGLEVIPFPSNFRTAKNGKYRWDSYMPSSLQGAYDAMHEYLGLVFYKMAY